MNVDLRPSSTFVPDPAVAGRRPARDTLTVPQERASACPNQELTSGNVASGAASEPCGDSLRAAIAAGDVRVLTITFNAPLEIGA